MIRLFAVLSFCGLLWLAGCQTAPRKPDAVQESNARDRIEAGDFRAAGIEYERLAAEQRSLRDYYRLLAAEAWREEAEFDEVARLLAAIRRKRLDAEQNLRVDLLEAELALARGEPARAADLLSVETRRIPAIVRLRWLEVKARALAATGRVLDAARTRLALLAELPAEERREAHGELLNQLIALRPERLHAALAPMPADDVLRPWLERALRVHGEAPARAPIPATEAVGTMFAGADGQLWREGFAPVRRLAVLLPLSGEYAAAGKAILDGVMSMHFQAPIAGSVLVYDVGDDRHSAIAAYRQALADGVDAVLGPVERNQVDAILEIGDSVVPLLALNHPEPKTIPARDGFFFGLMPEEEAAFAAERLVAEGANRIAVFGVNEDWSERAMAAFTAQLHALGGEISGRRMLRDGEVDFAEAITALIGAPGETPDRRKADGIFIALRPTTARLLLPQLRADGFTDLPMLATSHVYSGSNQTLHDKDLEGLVFLDAPWVHGDLIGLPMRSELGRDLESAQTGPRLFAFGLDAYRLVPYLDFLRAKPGRYFDGASGRLLSDPFGRIRRLPKLYRFIAGQARPATAIRLSTDRFVPP